LTIPQQAVIVRSIVNVPVHGSVLDMTVRNNPAMAGSEVTFVSRMMIGTQETITAHAAPASRGGTA
jgi:hypothetical protein